METSSTATEKTVLVALEEVTASTDLSKWFRLDQPLHRCWLQIKQREQHLAQNPRLHLSGSDLRWQRVKCLVYCVDQFARRLMGVTRIEFPIDRCSIDVLH